ncbi:MAG: hypothetical protein KI790_14475, partial [Cyclobacteriaceae bacterium]|nr:hypothetical protein [Cyclobacteriaceae bacterium HetDA_MAG_MS6]
MYHLPNYARGLAIFCISFVISVTSYSQTTSAGNGDWNDPTTWVGGTVPTSGDVIIATGHTVIYNANHNTSNAVTISSLDVQGTGALVWPFSDDAAYDAVFTLTVTGAVTTAASASITTRQGDSGTTLAGLATDRTHQFNIGGNVTNAGTFTLLHDNAGTDDVGKIVNLDFTNTLQLSGAGTYTTYNIDIQTGNTVTFNDITINICSDDDNSGDLDLQGGVGNGSTLIVTGASADVNIYHQVDVLQESKFQVDNGTVDAGLNNVTANQIFDLSQDAELEINAGNMTIGPDLTSVGNDMLRLIGSGCIVDVNGGNLTVGNTTSGEGEMITNAATTT